MTTDKQDKNSLEMKWLAESSLWKFARWRENMGMSPLQIIYEYLVQTNQEGDALEMIPKLAKRQTEKVQKQLDYARSWIPNKIDIFAGNKGITREEAKTLDLLTDYFCLGMEVPEYYIEKARETVEHMKTPMFVFVPMVEWLRDKYGIRFIDEEVNCDT